MADIESMYAMLCDVQQCAAQEEETMKQLKVNVVRLREAKEALSASFQALQSETNVQRALVDQHTKEIEVAQFDMRTSLEVCNELRRARLATFDASAQLTDEAYAVWKQMMDGLRSRAALHAQQRSNQPNRGPTTDESRGTTQGAPISQKFQIRVSAGSVVKKTLFNFR